MKKIKVLMIGPARNVKGGMTTVIDNYYNVGLDKEIELKYVESCNDKNILKKAIKEIKGYIEFKHYVKDYDIVHIHMASRRSTFRKIRYIKTAKRLNKKVIVHIHGGGYSKFFDQECNEKKKKYIKKYLNKADKIIVLSKEWKEYFSKILDNAKIEIIHNGVLLPSDYDKDLSNKNILFMGRINEKKGIYDLIKVISLLKKQYKDICLYVGGSGEEDRLKSIIKDYKLDENIQMLGWINGVQKDELFRKCAFFVLPSYFEAMPMSVLEAMSYKCITISTEIGGIPQMIKSGENGFLVKPGDVNSLYKILDELLKNEDKRKEISYNGRTTVEENFDIKKGISKIIELYK